MNNGLNFSEINLLGYFDKSNRYWLPDKIVREISSSEKIIIKEEENAIYCQIRTLKHKLNLVMYLDYSDPKDIAYARLYLVEAYRINNEIKKITTFIQKYTTFSADGFLERVKTVFKLINIDDDGKDIKESSYIDDYLLKKQKIYRTLINETAQQNKEFIEKVFDVLKQTKDGLNIIKELSILMQNCTFNNDSIGYWFDIKEKLEKLLKEKQNGLSQQQVNMLLLLRRDYEMQNKALMDKFNDLNSKLVKQYQDDLIIAPIDKDRKMAKELKNIPVSEMSKEQMEKYVELVKDENYPAEYDNKNMSADSFDFLKDFDFSINLEDWFTDILGAFTFISLFDMLFEDIKDLGKELNVPFDFMMKK